MNFEQPPKPQENKESKKERTKQEAQQELREKFGMAETKDFIAALQKGEIEKCEEWLQYILDNIANFPQYRGNQRWAEDRQKEIEIYKELKVEGKLESLELRSKEEAQQELIEKFGFGDTAGFRNALADSKVELVKEWLQYVVDNKEKFPQYWSSWERWIEDREKEIEKVENK